MPPLPPGGTFSGSPRRPPGWATLTQRMRNAGGQHSGQCGHPDMSSSVRVQSPPPKIVAQQPHVPAGFPSEGSSGPSTPRLAQAPASAEARAPGSSEQPRPPAGLGFWGTGGGAGGCGQVAGRALEMPQVEEGRVAFYRDRSGRWRRIDLEGPGQSGEQGTD